MVNVLGPPGIGRAVAARKRGAGAARGVEVFWAFCESHASDIPFGVVCAATGAGTRARGFSDDDAARGLGSAPMPDADPQDLQLLDDMLGIADPDVPLAADQTRMRGGRRLTALINTPALLARTATCTAHHRRCTLDRCRSASRCLADFLTVIPRTIFDGA